MLDPSPLMTSEAQQLSKRENDLQHGAFQRINHPCSGDESQLTPHRAETHLCVCFVLLKGQSLFALTGHGSIELWFFHRAGNVVL